MSEKCQDKMFTIIHNKMDHSKTASPHYSYKNKGTDSFMTMHVVVKASLLIDMETFDICAID